MRMILAAVVAVCLTACSSPSPEPLQLTEVTTFDSPTPDGSALPNLAPGRSTTHLSWLQKRAEGGHSLRLSVLDQGVRSDWSSPTTIIEGSSFFANWADFPSVVAIGESTLLAHWLEKRPGSKYSYDVMYRVSGDLGHSWSDSLPLHDDGTATEHGFVSLVALDGNRAGAVWLDGRETATGSDESDGHGGHDGHGAGAMTLRFATIDKTGTILSTTRIDERVCDCCGTAATVVGDDVLVFYRDRSDEEIRDIGWIRMSSGATPEVLDRGHVSDDGWQIKGCPVNGPAADSLDDLVVVAWFTSANDQPQALAAFSHDGGKTYDEPIRIAGLDSIGRVDVAIVDDHRAVVSWLEDGPESGTIFARVIETSGAVGEPIPIAETSAARASGFPQMTLTGNGVLFAWTNAGDPSQIRTALLR